MTAGKTSGADQKKKKTEQTLVAQPIVYSISHELIKERLSPIHKGHSERKSNLPPPHYGNRKKRILVFCMRNFCCISVFLPFRSLLGDLSLGCGCCKKKKKPKKNDGIASIGASTGGEYHRKWEIDVIEIKKRQPEGHTSSCYVGVREKRPRRREHVFGNRGRRQQAAPAQSPSIQHCLLTIQKKPREMSSSEFVFFAFFAYLPSFRPSAELPALTLILFNSATPTTKQFTESHTVSQAMRPRKEIFRVNDSDTFVLGV
jgi:hypothetical protein